MATMLICEGELSFQMLFPTFLRRTSHEIFMASNGIEGMALIERERPDLILTDIWMPDCDGFALAAQVRARPLFATIPIVFITGLAEKHDKAEAAKYTPTIYLIKPFLEEDLKDTI